MTKQKEKQKSSLPRRRRDLRDILTASPKALSYKELMSELGFARESSVASLIDRLRNSGVDVAQGLVERDNRLIVVFHTRSEVIREEQRWTRADIEGLFETLKRPRSVDLLTKTFNATGGNIHTMLATLRAELADDADWELVCGQLPEPSVRRFKFYQVVRKDADHAASKVAAE